MSKIVVIAGTLVGFLALTLFAVAEFGYIGFFEVMNTNLATRLAMLDLTIALSLALVWMWREADATGIAFWPYAAVTLVFGAAGPLGFLLHRELRSELAPEPARA